MIPNTTNREAKFRKSASRYYHLLQYGLPPERTPSLLERFLNGWDRVRKYLGRV